MKSSFQIRNFPIQIGSWIVWIAAITSACNPPDDTKHVSITFEALVNGLPLIIGTERYQNPNGEGEFSVENFKFFLSNLKLLDDSNNVLYSEPESYHLLRFNDKEIVLQLDIHNSARNFNKIQFSIGIDSIANKNITQVGDLNPNGSMAWNWTTGYKFLVMEGNYYQKDQDTVPLVYHIGFSENLHTFVFDLTPIDTEINSMAFKVELSNLFKGEHIVNFESMPSITFNKANAQYISKNLGNLILVEAIHVDQ